MHAHDTGTSVHEHTHGHDDQMDLQVEGEVLGAYWARALDLVRREAGDGPVRRVVDLGAGIGTGALGLAERFPRARVTAVDTSAESLRRFRERADAAGLADRVDALEVDLDGAWPAGLADLDLTWASMSLHHLTDPVRVLRDLREATRVGGLLVVAEFTAGLRFLPHDVGVGRPGLEERLMTANEAAHTEVMPTLGGDWHTLVTEAGWADVVDHALEIDQPGSAHLRTGELAHVWFSRMASSAADRVPAQDRPALEALLEPGGEHAVLTRGDLHVRGTRTLTVARRA